MKQFLKPNRKVDYSNNVDQFEDFLKQEASNFSLTPSAKVWKGVQAGISKPKRIGWIWYAASVLVIATGTSLGYFWWSSAPQGVNSKSTITIENKVPDTAILPQSNINKDELTQEVQTANQPKKEQFNNVINKNNASYKPTKSNNVSSVVVITNDKSSSKQDSHKQFAMSLSSFSKFINYSTSIQSINPIAPTLRKPAISGYQVKPQKMVYSISAGTNLSKPLNAGYKNFVKPGLGYSLVFTLRYNFSKRLGISGGVGLQKNHYKVGAVMISPETIYLNAYHRDSVAQSAQYRLSNESMNNNITRQMVFPMAVHYNLFLNPFGGNLSLFAGMDLSKILSAKYLIKSNTNDRLFFNKDFLNSYTTYMSFGVSYYHKLNKTMGWMCNYKMQYQAGNTFQNNYSLKEHLFINGLNLGLLF